MFGFRKKQEKARPYEEAMIVTITLEGNEKLGTPEERSVIATLEERMRSLLPDGCELDGHEYGEGEATLYLYGPSADTLYEVLGTELRASLFRNIVITLRYGSADDANAQEKTFSL